MMPLKKSHETTISDNRREPVVRPEAQVHDMQLTQMCTYCVNTGVRLHWVAEVVVVVEVYLLKTIAHNILIV